MAHLHGGVSDDFGIAITVDTSEDIYVAGVSPATWGAPVNPHAGGRDAFVAKIAVTSYYVFDGHDFSGNGASDISVWRPSNGVWYIKGQPGQGWAQQEISRLMVITMGII